MFHVEKNLIIAKNLGNYFQLLIPRRDRFWQNKICLLDVNDRQLNSLYWTNLLCLKNLPNLNMHARIPTKQNHLIYEQQNIWKISSKKWLVSMSPVSLVFHTIVTVKLISKIHSLSPLISRFETLLLHLLGHLWDFVKALISYY